MVDAADHIGLVYRIAFQFAKRTKVPVEDLVQEGAIGLMKAVEKFDPERGAFWSCAYWWVYAEITRHVRDHGGFFRTPRSETEKRKDPISFDTTLEYDNGHEYTLHDVIPDHAPSPEDVVAEWQRDRLIWREVGRLPKRMRSIRRVRFEDDMTLEEIGEVFDLSRERIRQILDAAYLQLGPRLEADT